MTARKTTRKPAGKTGKKAAGAKQAAAKPTGAKQTGAKPAPKQTTAAKQPAAKRAQPKPTPAAKTAAKRPETKPTEATKTTAKPAEAKPTTAAKAAPEPQPREQAGSAAPARPAGSEAPEGPIRAASVNLGHVFALRPRVNTSFPQEFFRTAKERLADESYATLEEAARAVATKALELTQQGGRNRGLGQR